MIQRFGIHPVEWFTSRELNICTDTLLPQNWHHVFSAYWAQTGSQKPGVPAAVRYHFPPADLLNPRAVMHKEPTESLIIVPVPEESQEMQQLPLPSLCMCKHIHSEDIWMCWFRKRCLERTCPLWLEARRAAWASECWSVRFACRFVGGRQSGT